MRKTKHTFGRWLYAQLNFPSKPPLVSPENWGLFLEYNEGVTVQAMATRRGISATSLRMRLYRVCRHLIPDRLEELEEVYRLERSSLRRSNASTSGCSSTIRG